MFGTTHILYMIITGAVLFGIVILALVKKSDRLNRFLIRLFAILTLAIQYSVMWVEYFGEKDATVYGDLLLPIYPCNVCMWLLFVSSLILDKRGWVASSVRDFTFWATMVCCTIGTVFNYNFAAKPDLTDYYILKGLLTHATTVYGAAVLLISGYAKIRVGRALRAVALGLLLFFVDGVLVNAIYAFFGLPEVNAMYLLEPPFAAMPWFNTAFIGLLAILVAFIVSVIYEQIALKHEERWYSVLKHPKR